MFADKHFTKSA